MFLTPTRSHTLPRRVLLSIMYLMVETIRVQTEDDRPEWAATREAFKNELGVCACCAFIGMCLVADRQFLLVARFVQTIGN